MIAQGYRIETVTTEKKARKEHSCHACKETISIGEKYVSNPRPGVMYPLKFHKECAKKDGIEF